MKKIVFLDSDTLGSDISLEPISSLGEFVKYPFTKPEEVFERIKECNVIITNKVVIGKEQIDAARNLELICVAATGTNNVDIPYATAKGIPVRNAVGYSTESVVQVTFTTLLSLVGKLPYFDNAVKSGRYSAGVSFTDVSKVFWELKGKKMGIIGLGNIGSKVAAIAKAFGMEVKYYATSGIAHSKEYEAVELKTLMAESDVISIHAPLNERTGGLVGYEELKLMKKSAYILNMGRGGIIKEDELVRALNEGLIAGAAIDVYTKEPLPADSPYFKIEDMSKVILTPHIAWASKEARKCLVEKIAENIRQNC